MKVQTYITEQAVRVSSEETEKVPTWLLVLKRNPMNPLSSVAEIVTTLQKTNAHINQ